MLHEFTDDDILDYWDSNKDHISNAVPLDQLSEADIICDYFPDVDKELASQIINAIPEEFDFNTLSEEIDEKHISTIIQERKFTELEKYFQSLMPATVASDNTPHNRNRQMGEFITVPGRKSASWCAQIPTTNGAALSNPQSTPPSTPPSTPQPETASLPADELDTLTPVPEKSLKNTPYRSVGKLSFVRPGYEDYQGTAFYIGDGKIVSAAHNFDSEVEKKKYLLHLFRETLHYIQQAPRKPVFVPAMIDEDDCDGKLYGRYIVQDVKIHPSYRRRYWKGETFCPLNDICTARISRGGKNWAREEFHPDPTGQEESTSLMPLTLMPLPLLPYRPLTTKHRVWKVIGYVKHLHNGRMLQMDGIESRKDESNESEIIEITPAVKKGMSGGPWICDFETRGIQSSILIGISCSPRVTEEMLRNVDALPSNSEETNEGNQDANSSA